MPDDARLPHYALETFSSTAPEYMNLQQDIIRQGFNIGNFTWLKESVPVELGPDTVLAVRRLRMEKGRGAIDPLKPATTWAKMASLWGGGFYPEFEFLPDPYDAKEQLKRKEAHESIRKRDLISVSGWKPSSGAQRLDYEPMVVSRDELEDPRKKQPYPRLIPGEEDRKPRSARGPPVVPFVTGRSHLLDDVRKQKGRLPAIVRVLQQRLDADWSGCTVVVTANDQDLVQVAFYEATLDSERGAMAYMNVLIRQDLCCEQLGLRKVPQLWGRKRDFTEELRDVGEDNDEPATWVVFMLAPSWVKMRVTDAVYTLYPRQFLGEGSLRSWKLSDAGKSVMEALRSVSMSVGSTTAGGPSAKESSLMQSSAQLSQQLSTDVGRPGREQLEVAARAH